MQVIKAFFWQRMVTFPPFYFFSVIGLSIAFYFLLPEFNWVAFPYNLIGIILFIGGSYLLNASSGLFNQKQTTFYLEEPSVFVMSGFYKISRNPMYLGALVLIMGLAILLGNLLSLLTPLLFFIFINYLCIPPEEKIMQQTFGQDYLDYKQSVRRWL